MENTNYNSNTDSKIPTWLRSLLIVTLLWLFLCSVNGIGASFKYFKEVVDLLLGGTQSNPILGLLVGVLATSLVQSSSTTTALVVGLVASGTVSVEQAVPIIMGANIGTTITNTLVSMGSITRKAEFKRAFAAANIHDIFNLLAVIVFLPLEYFTGFISKSAIYMSGFFYGASIDKPNSPIKAHFKSVIKSFKGFLEDVFGPDSAYIALLILSTIIMIVSLALIVKTMKGVVLSKAEVFFNKFVGHNAVIAMVFGMIITALAQSSSVTTSLMVPLAGAGVISLRNFFPVTIGCNVGTTITALLAAVASGEKAALSIALCHVLFNVYGIVVLYAVRPIRELILTISTKLAALCAERRWVAPVYVLVVFFGVPGFILSLQHWDKIMTWMAG